MSHFGLLSPPYTSSSPAYSFSSNRSPNQLPKLVLAWQWFQLALYYTFAWNSVERKYHGHVKMVPGWWVLPCAFLVHSAPKNPRKKDLGFLFPVNPRTEGRRNLKTRLFPNFSHIRMWEQGFKDLMPRSCPVKLNHSVCRWEPDVSIFNHLGVHPMCTKLGNFHKLQTFRLKTLFQIALWDNLRDLYFEY